MRTTALALTLVAGCSSLFHAGWKDAEVPVEGRRVAVIPFGDAAEPAFRSELGSELAQRVLRELEDRTEARLVSFLELRDALGEGGPAGASTGEVARRAGAEVYVEGEVVEFHTRPPRTIGLLQGRLGVALKVVDVSKARVLVERVVAISFPEDEREFGVLEEGPDADARIREVLLARAARNIGRIFYEHGPEEERR
ncbi:MAG: hypothetical protein HY722_12655 [Planctomycetes bacterium]|nr:hypothetical protein [Planctomycetota bacterium]